VNRAV